VSPPVDALTTSQTLEARVQKMANSDKTTKSFPEYFGSVAK